MDRLVTFELTEDAPNLGAVLRDSLAKAFAIKLDAASLYGSGTAPTPRGVKNVSGVQVVPVATDGCPAAWEPLTNLTVGTATNCSDSFVGDWSALAIGIRTQFQLKVLKERYADTGEIGFIGWLRVDVQVTRPEAFYVVSGIKP